MLSCPKNHLFKRFLQHCCYFRIDVFPLGVYSLHDFSFCSFKVNGMALPVNLRLFKEKQYLHDSSFLLSFAPVLMATETTGLNMQPKARCRSVTVVAQVSTRLNSVTLQIHRSRILLWTWRWALQFLGMHCSLSVQSWLHQRDKWRNSAAAHSSKEISVTATHRFWSRAADCWGPKPSMAEVTKTFQLMLSSSF